jgi:hypothetical protein
LAIQDFREVDSSIHGAYRGKQTLTPIRLA